MIEFIKKLNTPKTALSIAETELAEAERDYLAVVAKAEYYDMMAECLTMRILRLREVVRTRDVLPLGLELPEDQTGPPPVSIH